MLLQPHGNTHFPWQVTVNASRPQNKLLALRFRIDGAVERLRLPPPSEPTQAHQLWRQTCCEAFLRIPGEQGYIEVNLSPSTQWALYRFDGYRHGMRALSPAQPPEISLLRRDDSLSLQALVHLDGLIPTTTTLCVALCAVLQDHHGLDSFWALSHPGPEPDFHDPRSATLKLPSPAIVTSAPIT